MTNPVTRATRASGTMAYHPISSIAIQAARTVCASGLAATETPSTRYAMTAPIQPTEHVRCTVSTSLRRLGARVTAVAPPLLSPACGHQRHRTAFGDQGNGHGDPDEEHGASHQERIDD